MVIRRIVARRPLTAEEQRIAGAIARSVRAFLPYWTFTSRDTGQVQRLTELWPGQEQFVALTERADWIIALKAGKLGYSELGCAYDAWRLITVPNARVHLFSLDATAAAEMLRWVRYGLERLPDWMRLPVADGGGTNTMHSLRLEAGPDDVRTIVSYASGTTQSIDQVATHSHVDEFARMPHAEQLWQAISSTISPAGGTCHIISRGAGPNYMAELWRAAVSGASGFAPLFAPWNARPGRDETWRSEQAARMTAVGLRQFAPETWQEALQGDASYVYPQFEAPPGRHVVDYDPVPLGVCERVAVGVDPGGGHPTALVLVGERSAGLHVYDEWSGQHVGAGEIARVLGVWEARLQESAGDGGLGAAELAVLASGLGPYFDPGRVERAAVRRLRVFVPNDEPTLIATLGAMGFDVWQANREKDMGIRLVTERLNAQVPDGPVVGYAGDVPVRLSRLTMHRRCGRLRDEFMDYRWVAERDGETRVQYAGERTVRHHADHLDALRYALMGLATWQEVAPVRVGGRIYG